MQLRTPGTLDAAMQTLRVLRRAPERWESSAIAFLSLRDTYLEWVHLVDTHLRNLFTDGYLADGLRGKTYSEIRQTNQGTPAAWSVLRREIQHQTERLRRAENELCELTWLAGRPGDIVVPDTSALVHGIWFEHFHWQKEFGLSSHVRLIIPILVVEELDGLKDRDHGNDGKRARRVLRRLNELSETVPPGHPASIPTRTNVTVEVHLNDEQHQRHPNNDDEIVAEALRIKALTGRKVTLVTLDTAMTFRARHRGLDVATMPRINEEQAKKTRPGL